MKDEYAYLRFFRQYNQFGVLELEIVTWEGKSRKCIISSYRDIKIEKENFKYIKVGPYKLRYLHIVFDGYVYHRNENIWDKFLIFLYPITRNLDLAYRRFIITLAVWNLAKFNYGGIPSLDDVYVVNKIKNMFRKDK